MEPGRPALTRPLALLGATLGYFALVTQFCLLIQVFIASGRNPLGAIAQFFGYFTILTNILVALAFTADAVPGTSGWLAFFRRPAVRAGLALFILVVGVVYNVVLRTLWNPQGLQLVVDAILHTAVPVLYILYWFWATIKGQLRWTDPFRWLIYPLAYLGFMLMHGALSGFYPYPFVDPTRIGYGGTMRNAFFLTAGLLIIGFLWVAFDRMLGRARTDR